MTNLRNILKKINIDGEIRFNESMAEHTTFKTGGNADVYIRPSDENSLTGLLQMLASEMIPYFIIGGGSNLLVADSGIRGAVVDTSSLNSIEIEAGGILTAGCGAVVDRIAEKACEDGLQGFDSFYGMPGTIGGAVWMNARCYGRSISDILKSVRYLDPALKPADYTFKPEDFEYKHSPFQSNKGIILSASFSLEKGAIPEIEAVMQANRSDRESKGHYSAPCAGSVFKNNRDFGKPSGQIIDSLGLRGLKEGGAMISEKHANIIINPGTASSSDIYRLIKLTAEKVYEAYGFSLEPEVRFAGDFSGL